MGCSGKGRTGLYGRMGGRLIDCFSRLDSRIDSLIHSLEITGAH